MQQNPPIDLESQARPLADTVNKGDSMKNYVFVAVIAVVALVGSMASLAWFNNQRLNSVQSRHLHNTEACSSECDLLPINDVQKQYLEFLWDLSGKGVYFDGDNPLGDEQAKKYMKQGENGEWPNRDRLQQFSSILVGGAVYCDLKRGRSAQLSGFKLGLGQDFSNEQLVTKVRTFKEGSKTVGWQLRGALNLGDDSMRKTDGDDECPSTAVRSVQAKFLNEHPEVDRKSLLFPCDAQPGGGVDHHCRWQPAEGSESGQPGETAATADVTTNNCGDGAAPTCPDIANCVKDTKVFRQNRKGVWSVRAWITGPVEGNDWHCLVDQIGGGEPIKLARYLLRGRTSDADEPWECKKCN